MLNSPEEIKGFSLQVHPVLVSKYMYDPNSLWGFLTSDWGLDVCGARAREHSSELQISSRKQTLFTLDIIGLEELDLHEENGLWQVRKEAVECDHTRYLESWRSKYSGKRWQNVERKQTIELPKQDSYCNWLLQPG